MKKRQTFVGFDKKNEFHDDVYSLIKNDDSKEKHTHIVEISTIYNKIVLFVVLLEEYEIVEILKAFIKENVDGETVDVECEIKEAMQYIVRNDLIEFLRN